MQEQPQTDLLQDLEQEWQYEDATTGQRFANYLIDLVAFYVTVFVLTFFLALTMPNDELFIVLENTPDILDRIITLILFGFFIAIVEGFSKGGTLGKLITGTMAIRNDGHPFTWSDAIGRGFSRMVPFEPFSALGGTPWHDKWTNTRVVKVRR